MTIEIVRSEIRHLPFLKLIIDELALFPSEYLDGMMNDFFTNADTSDCWLTMLVNEAPAAIVYFAPERLTEGTFNLYLIAVKKELHGAGLGSQFLTYVEDYLKQSGHRLLIVETSGLSEFELTWKFYERCGYNKEATIRDFYNEGEDKIVFWKKLR